jgi:predicted aspartyl protease
MSDNPYIGHLINRMIPTQLTRRAIRFKAVAIALPALLMAGSAAALAPEAPSLADKAGDELTEIVIQAPEPRYVAPTRRDRIGRIWAPVLINGKGPFRLVLDTGASRSGVTAHVAATLGIPLDQSAPVMLQGVTGSAVVPTIRIDTFSVGELWIKPAVLPIVTDALGGAEGILGTEAFADKRIVIDFRHDVIIISYSRGQRADRGFLTVPIEFSRGRLLVVDAKIGGVRAKAIIDTGGQVTIANLALRDALIRQRDRDQATPDRIEGATTDIQVGEGFATPPIEFGAIRIRGAHITFGDMRIFEHWELTQEPAMLIGMDALGLLDTLIIDYRRSELQIRTAAGV